VFVVRTPSGRVECRCVDCRDAGGAHVSLVSTSVPTVGGGDKWSANDRAWFASHPGRRWRIRAPVPGEVEVTLFDAASLDTVDTLEQQLPPGTSLAVVVHQHRPGVRERCFAYSDQPLESFTEAGIARLLGAAALAKSSAPVPETADEQAAFLCERIRRRCRVTKLYVATPEDGR
jgi:hypothetical protein